MERVQSDRSKLSALGARRTPDVSLALSSSRLGGVTRDPHHEPILQSTASSAQPGLAPTQRWNNSSISTPRGPRSSKIPGKNMYGSLSSAIGPSKDCSHVNYTVSEDATESNLLNKLSRMLAILDESILIRLFVITNTESYEEDQNYQTAHHITPTKKGAMPDAPYTFNGPSNSPGLGYPTAVGQDADILRSAFVAKKQIATMNAEFASWITSERIGLTKRQMWYDLASRHPKLDEHKIRFVIDYWLRFGVLREDEIISSGGYLNIVSHALYGVTAFSEVTRMFGALTGPRKHWAKVSDLLRSIASCDDRANLQQVILSIDRERTGVIDISNWIDYMHSFA